MFDKTVVKWEMINLTDKGKKHIKDGNIDAQGCSVHKDANMITQ